MKILRSRVFFPLGFLLLLLPSAIFAQEGVLSGRVVDAETGAPIAGAAVEVLAAVGGQVGGVLTGAGGEFRFTLPTGAYAVVGSMIGHETRRMDGISLGTEGTEIVVELRTRAFIFNPIVVSASRREEKALDAPASVSLIGRERIRDQIAVTPADHIRSVAGVDVAQTGIQQSNVVARGFNNVFSGSLLAITDNRYAHVPSLRVNVLSFSPTTDLDLERVEVVLGPGAALYGPNAASGVMHMITSSPIDRPGTVVSVAGGERSILHTTFRHATALSDRFGFKVSGQYFQGRDWEYTDPIEEAAREEALAGGSDPETLLIGRRDFDASRWSADLRMDWRPDERSEVILSAGMNDALSMIELTGLGAGQAEGWRYQYAQARYLRGRLFAQAFLNQTDAGDTYLLRTGQPIVDKSRMFAGQVQHGFDLGERQSFVYGVDLQRTEPRTEGTITGRNETDDIIDEAGIYLHSESRLSEKFDFVAALRLDHHSRLEDPNISPRAAIVFRPRPEQTFRFTFNRAFSTPTTNNLFLDLVAGRIPVQGPIGYDIRTLGVPEGGFTFDERCGGVHCMRSPFVQGGAVPLPADGSLLWDGFIDQLDQLPEAIRGALMAPGANPGDPAIGSVLRRFDQEIRGFVPDPGVENIASIRSTITNTLELGYKGMIADRLLLSADLYRSRVNDFVGPLRVETPTVFYDPQSLVAFMTHRLTPLVQAGAISQEMMAGMIQQVVGSAQQPGLAAIPLGTIAPDQAPATDLLLTYRNFGDVDFWGGDLAAQFIASDRLSFRGSYSFVSDDCFLFSESEGESCSSALDIALNAPKRKGSVSARFEDARSGFTMEGRARFSSGFPMNSGVFVGTVDGHTLFDLSASYRIGALPGATLSLSGSNLLDRKTRHFIGAPEIGRLLLLRLQYEFR